MQLDSRAATRRLPRIRAKRKPLHYWWPAFTLLLLTLALWSKLPINALLYEPRRFAPFPKPCAAYLELSPEYTARLLADLRLQQRPREHQSYATGKLDLSFQPTPFARPTPPLLETQLCAPPGWQPASLTWPDAGTLVPPHPLPQPEGIAGGLPLEQQYGSRTHLSQALAAMDFNFEMPAAGRLSEAGEATFHLSTDARGRVKDLLLLSSPAPATAILEQALIRGRAKGAAAGRLTIMWRFAATTKGEK